MWLCTSFLPTEEEASTEQVSEQTSFVVHLGEDGLIALRTDSLDRIVPQWTDCR